MGIQVKKLAKTTNIRDCSSTLWRWLEMSQQEVGWNGVSPIKNGFAVNFPLIGSLPFEVWQAKSQAGKVYGVTREAAIENLRRLYG